MAWEDTDRVPIPGKGFKRVGEKDGWEEYKGPTGTRWRVKGKRWQRFMLSTRPAIKRTRWQNAYVVFTVTGDVHWMDRLNQECRRRVNEGDMMFLKVRSVVDGNDVSVELKDDDGSTLEMDPSNLGIHPVRNTFFTGKTGAEHRTLVLEGEDYIVCDIHGMNRVIWKETIPTNTDTMLNNIDYGEWVRVRARSYEEALANYPAALEQYEAFIEQDVRSFDLQNKWCE